MTTQGSAYMRFRRALDRGNVTEALSAASELQFVALAEALELTLLLVDGAPPPAGISASLRRFRTSTSAKVRQCSRSSRPFLGTGWLLPRWPSSSAVGDHASELPKLLSAGRERRRTRRTRAKP